MRHFISFLIPLFLIQPLLAQQAQDPNMRWFGDAKLGIFIHWGIYAVNGIDESWSFHNGYISHEDYMKQLQGFSASKYDPAAWAALIKESGARYAVLTSRHHDGVALWDSKAGDLNVVKKTPAGRDLVGPFCDALRKEKLKVGLYYSLSDWSHPDYTHFLRDSMRYQIADDTARWQRFLKYMNTQLEELSDTYRPDLYWFDGDWEHSAEEWRSKDLRDMLKKKNPQVVLNSRLQGYGDYATPEQGVPLHKPEAPYWELCMTMNDSWGYQRNDHHYKSAGQIIQIFADCLGMGGNLLLDIGPQADGSIPEEQVAILKELGRWTKKHSEAIFGSRAGLPPGYFYGPSTVSADSSTLFLFLPYRPNGPIAVRGLKNSINRIRVVGAGTKLKGEVFMKAYWSERPGILYIDVPEFALDEQMTVIAIQLKGKLAVHEE